MIERYVVSYKLGIQITHEDYLYLMTHHTRFSTCVFSPSPSLSLSVTHLYIRVCLCNCCVYQLRPFPSGSYIVVAVLRSDLPLQTLRLQATVHRSAHRPSQSASTATRSVHSCCVKRIASFGRWHRGRQEQDLRRPDDRHLAKNRQSESPEPHAVPRVRHVRVYGYRQMCVAVLCLRARARRADGGMGMGVGDGLGFNKKRFTKQYSFASARRAETIPWCVAHPLCPGGPCRTVTCCPRCLTIGPSSRRRRCRQGRRPVRSPPVRPGR